MSNITLQAFFSNREGNLARHAELAAVLSRIAEAAARVAMIARAGALAKPDVWVAEANPHGELQKPLDVEANRIFIEVLRTCPAVAVVASEEMDDAIVISDSATAQYAVAFDPLDGSANLELNVTVGSIFSVLPSRGLGEAAFMQAGHAQLAAGYVLYGLSTMLVLTLGSGVHGFTFAAESGEFILSHPDMRFEPDTAEFAINMSNQRFWEAPVQRYISECIAGRSGPRGKDFNMRWVGAMVAEVHRLLVRGGIFLYPVDAKTREKGGRLRLVYEANPMGWIIEQAGGMASTGYQPILDIQPVSLHQRVPVILGVADEVALLRSYHA
jgi:fructose-1,6-bisphosphatase